MTHTAYQDETLDSIICRPPVETNPPEILRLLSRGVRMNLGARGWTYDRRLGYVAVRIGAANVVRKAIVKHNEDGTYDLEIGRVHRRTKGWIIEAQDNAVPAEKVGERLIHAHHRVTLF